MSNTQLLINNCRTFRPEGQNVLQLLINSCVLLISEFCYYQRNYEPLQYQDNINYIYLIMNTLHSYQTPTSIASTTLTA